MTDRVLSAVRAFGSPTFIKFLGVSAVGLAIDLTGFTGLTLLGVVPGIANLCSSFASISVVYVLVTRFAFGSNARASTYIAFVTWYSTSILVFSSAIEVASSMSGVTPIFWKLASVPVSFGLNYLFSRRLLGRRRALSRLRREHPTRVEDLLSAKG